MERGEYCTPPVPSRMDPFDPSTYGSQPVLPAATIREALSSRAEPCPAGLQLRGLVIAGDLDLNNLEFPFPIWFHQCHFDGNLHLTNSKISQLALVSVSAQEVILDGAEISGGIHCYDRFEAKQVSITFAKIGHRVLVTNAHLLGDETYQIALALDATEVRGSVILQNFISAGQVRMHGTRISNRLEIYDSTLENPTGDALSLDGAEIDGGINAGKGFKSRGRISAFGTKVGVALEFSGAEINSTGSEAFLADNAHIAGDVLCGGLSATGKVRCNGMRVDGSIFLDNAALYNPTDNAMELSGADIRQNIIARNRFRSIGTIRAPGARIGGRITLQSSHLFSKKESLDLRNATVAGGIEISGDSTSTGTISTVGAAISGDILLSNLHVDSKDGNAIVFENATIKGSVNISRVVTTGGLSCAGAEIAGALNMRGVQISNSVQAAVDLKSATLRRMTLTHITVEPGVNLSRATVSDLEITGDMPTLLAASGLSVSDMHGALRNDWKVANTWLSSIPSRMQPAQPWHALAAVYERNGDPAAARRLRYQAARRVTMQSRGWSKVVRLMYGAVVGHGYYPLVAALWLGAVMLLGCVVVANTRENIIPTRPTEAAASGLPQSAASNQPPPPSVPITAETPCVTHERYPCMNTAQFAVASLSPASIATSTDWTVKSDASYWAVVPLLILKLAAWIFAAMLLAGFTGLLRKI